MPYPPSQYRALCLAAYERATPDHYPECPRCHELYTGRPWRKRCECGCALYPRALDDPRQRA